MLHKVGWVLRQPSYKYAFVIFIGDKKIKAREMDVQKNKTNEQEKIKFTGAQKTCKKELEMSP